MPENDLFRRSLDAGVAFTQLTRKRAEDIVRDWVRNGEVNREQATARVEELLERSRQNTDALLAMVRKEIDDRLAALNLVTREDLAHLASRLGLPGRGSKPVTTRSGRSGATGSSPKKATAAKSPAKKAATGSKSPAKKAPANTTTAKKTTAKKTTAKKAAAPRASSSRSGSAAQAAKLPAAKAGASSKKAGPSSTPRG